MRWLRPPRGPGGQDGASRSSRSERRPCMEAEPASCRPSSVFCVWAHLGSARKTASQLTRMASNASSRRRALSLVTLAALLFSAPGRRWLGSTLQAADVAVSLAARLLCLGAAAFKPHTDYMEVFPVAWNRLTNFLPAVRSSLSTALPSSRPVAHAVPGSSPPHNRERGADFIAEEYASSSLHPQEHSKCVSPRPSDPPGLDLAGSRTHGVRSAIYTRFLL